MLKKFLSAFLFVIAAELAAVIDIAVGTAPEKFIVEQIGGDKVNVFCVMPQGKNLHDFAVSPDMVRKTASSRVFFHTGLLFEEQLAKAVGRSKVRVVDLSRYVLKQIDPHFLQPNRHSHDDVHTWFCYGNLYRMAIEVEKVLSQIDGKNAAYYFKNRADFHQKINNGRHAAEKRLRKYGHRVFVTHHAAFGYFANEFNLRQVSFEFNGREMTPKNLARTVQIVKKYRIKRIFIQSTASENVRRAIMNATGAQLIEINPDSYNILENLNRFAAELEASFE